MKRREFLSATAAAVASLSLVNHSAVQGSEHNSVRGKIYKAQIIGFPTDDVCERYKKAGYDGIEVTKWNAPASETAAGRQIAEKHGLRIHSVMRAWTNVNQPDSFGKDVESVKTALKSAAAYGADTVLWVPCKIGKFPNPAKGVPDGAMPMPAAWDFDIDFDAATLKVKSVVDGNNAPYAEYIAAQNAATEATLRAVEALLPAAAYEGVRIGIENVWNNLWSTPKFYAALCRFFTTPWVGSYFDLGNHTLYAKPEEWLKALGGESLFKLHIKGFKVNEVKGKLGGGPGNWSKIDESSIDWQSVRRTLSDINYNGWMSVEDGGRSPEEYSKILDTII
ncbi:MAG: sugar phosphate isomerase/epimerase [Planctomycetaceae bacterium]|nr:sugar phosphate isomerase/epimerase [Planctomycetaceae bacterium]